LHGTTFQRQVWDALLTIPYGSTISYGQLAIKVGRTSPGQSRAVANANARNPIAIIVPCHRVIGSDNSLTGYAGGIWRKQALLVLEGARLL
jgi:O-6-methylguanine DNA methyltransferase